ncbi:hypothetical protein KC19_10G074300 [Ceratodon purpureus]|uniref:Uncharacterized protein n=1 Tax=Ceratodon purpureus TaxID=3225 RepID=A0A8T0GJ59_CERPU|nr:hypothetical protein KC19_10G074300 [Ceratodon purpureus]
MAVETTFLQVKLPSNLCCNRVNRHFVRIVHSVSNICACRYSLALLSLHLRMIALALVLHYYFLCHCVVCEGEGLAILKNVMVLLCLCEEMLMGISVEEELVFILEKVVGE